MGGPAAHGNRAKHGTPISVREREEGKVLLAAGEDDRSVRQASKQDQRKWHLVFTFLVVASEAVMVAVGQGGANACTVCAVRRRQSCRVFWASAAEPGKPGRDKTDVSVFLSFFFSPSFLVVERDSRLVRHNRVQNRKRGCSSSYTAYCARSSAPIQPARHTLRVELSGGKTGNTRERERQRDRERERGWADG